MGPLVDTSVLIDFFGGAATREAALLDRCTALEIERDGIQLYPAHGGAADDRRQ